MNFVHIMNLGFLFNLKKDINILSDNFSNISAQKFKKTL